MSRKYNVKEAIKTFQTYQPNTEEYIVKLDANESNQNTTLLSLQLDLSKINYYPDNYSVNLRTAIGNYINLDKDEIMVGAGSSELLELIVKTFINPGDKVLSISPSFVMYEKYTIQSNGVYETVKAKSNYETVVDDLINKAKDIKPKIIFLCTPNNPTGFMVQKEEVIRLLENTNCIVVVDEAYMEFATTDQTVKDYINQYDNLIVNRTFSKAFAIAGARLGYILANKELIQTLYTIKTPYSVNNLSQQIGVMSLQNLSYLQDNIKMIYIEKQWLLKKLESLQIKTYPSETNFLYVYFDQFDLGNALKKKQVLIRSFKNNYYRITVSNRIENEILIRKLEEILNENC